MSHDDTQEGKGACLCQTDYSCVIDFELAVFAMSEKVAVGNYIGEKSSCVKGLQDGKTITIVLVFTTTRTGSNPRASRYSIK